MACGHAAAVTDAARSYHRNFQGAHCRGDQDQIGNVVFAGMTGALEAIDADDVKAVALGGQRMPYCRALVQHFDAMLLESPNEFLRVVSVL